MAMAMASVRARRMASTSCSLHLNLHKFEMDVPQLFPSPLNEQCLAYKILHQDMHMEDYSQPRGASTELKIKSRSKLLMKRHTVATTVFSKVAKRGPMTCTCLGVGGA